MFISYIHRIHSRFPCLLSRGLRVTVKRSPTNNSLSAVKNSPFRDLGILYGVAFLRCHHLSWFVSHVSCEARPRTFTTSLSSEVPCKRYVWSWGYLLSLLWPECISLAGAILGALIAASMNVLIPVYLGQFVESLALCASDANHTFSGVSPSLKLCGAYLAQSIATFFYIAILASVGEQLSFRLRNDVFKIILHNEVAFFDSHNSGKLLDSLTTDVQTFKSSFKQCISIGIRSTAQVIGSFISLLSISTMLTGTLLSALPCVFLIGSLLGAELRRLSQEAHVQHSTAAAVAEESFTHIRSVKALGIEELQLQRYNNETHAARTLNERLGYGIGIFQGLSNLTLNGIVLGVLYVGGHLISLDQLKPGQLMAFLVTTQTIQRSMAQLSLLFSQVVRGRTALDRIFGVLHSFNYSEFRQQSQPFSSDEIRAQWSQPGHAPELCFDSVNFSYPTRPDTMVLDNFTMSIPAGKIVALVGKSGAGKSTVVSLIERFYNPSAGRITLGGRDIREFLLQSLRGQLIGYISQEPQIFNTSIRENIRLGSPGATDQQVEEAAHLANAHDFIVHQLPAGYETLVGQGSDSVAGLSGGQRQRIAIARVILKNSPVLILDEATSALDAESEAQVQEALRRVMKNRTVLVIAHRLSTVRGADVIVVMSQGKVIERGTHSSLMAKKGAYYQLVQRQEGSDLLD